jgi:hypothetical protein
MFLICLPSPQAVWVETNLVTVFISGDYSTRNHMQPGEPLDAAFEMPKTMSHGYGVNSMVFDVHAPP